MMTDQPTPTVEQIVAEQQAAADKREAGALNSHFDGFGLSATDPTGAEVREFATGTRSITPALRAEVEGKMEAWARDKEFQKRLLDGGQEEARLLAIYSAMITAPVKEGAP
jgi:hypothetical protein